MSVLTRFPAGAIFVETGLGGGDTLALACQQPYQQLHSIEIDASLIQRSADRFRYDDRVRIHHGSSPTILPRLCQPDLPTVFWLDAHYSAGQYTSDHQHDLDQLDPFVGQCALLAELAIIRSVKWQVWPVILIDDAACINMHTYAGMYAQHDRKQYPTRKEVRQALPPGYRLAMHDDGSGWYYAAERS